MLRFGAFRLIPARRELLLSGKQVALGERAFDLLVALLRRPGQLLTKDELMAVAWPAMVVDENNLPAQISAVRRVLAADPGLAQRLQTVSGRGYRFVGDVEVEASASPETVQGTAALSIVVLPFANLSGDIEQSYFAQAMSEVVTTDLSRISGLLVISASAAATYEGHAVDVRQASRDLGVRFVLKGSVQRSGQQVRMNVQLIDGRSGAQVWSQIFDGDRSDLFALQDRITGRIANSLGHEIFVAAARDGDAAHGDPRASDFVMKGIAADNRPQSLEVLREQERCFAEAVRLDPANGDAMAWLARAILLQSIQTHAAAPFRQEALVRGAEAAEKALSLKPASARAHLAMAYLHALRGDFVQCLLASERATALDRNLAMGHNMRATSFVHLGRGNDGVLAAETALRLEPIGAQCDVFRTTMGLARLLVGETGEAIECFSRARAANPKLVRAHVGAAIAFAISGNVAAARLAAEDLGRLAPDYRLSQTVDGCWPGSPTPYRRFYDEVLRPGAELAGVPV